MWRTPPCTRACKLCRSFMDAFVEAIYGSHRFIFSKVYRRYMEDSKICKGFDLRVQFGCFLKWWYPQIIHFNRGFHYKPSILGYPYFWKHLFLHQKSNPPQKSEPKKYGPQNHQPPSHAPQKSLQRIADLSYGNCDWSIPPGKQNETF